MSNPEFWNGKYSDESYLYGTKPNVFLARLGEFAPGGAAVLEAACGEGRNAVYLAGRGFRVTGVDFSSEALRKARALARRHGVYPEFIEADLASFRPALRFDAAVTAFLHGEPRQRAAYYRLLQNAVRPGGWVLGEWFRPEQRTDGYSSGGPPSPEAMVTAEELREAFAEWHIELLEETEYTLREGRGHKGPGAVVRLAAQKPAQKPAQQATRQSASVITGNSPESPRTSP